MLNVDLDSGRLWAPGDGTVFADRPYAYALSGRVSDGPIVTAALSDRKVVADGDAFVLTGTFPGLDLALHHRVLITPTGVEETVSLANRGPEPVALSDVGLGFCAALDPRPDWRLCAIPFRVQLDGSRHDYVTADLAAGRFANAVCRDTTRPEPPLCEDGRLRSESWAWGTGNVRLVIIKYNQADVELSVAAPLCLRGEHVLRFGGAGTCLYGEPSAAHALAPGQTFTFGATFYASVAGPVENAFYAYRDFLDARGHGFPPDYDPPVNWNELYDVGWYHSEAEPLAKNYTRKALLAEAAKARDVGCDLLYLDPGWEVAEGTTTWDESRLGSPADLARTLRRDFGLDLGFRTVLRVNSPRPQWPERYLVRHPDGPKRPADFHGRPLWECCLANPEFRREKVERIHAVVRQGARFLMVDEMDWRGPCHDPGHDHATPTAPIDHVRAVYDLCRQLRRLDPHLLIECHDPVWPWHTALYVPTYFQQGFGEEGAYQENWGFEYMWNCLDDLKSGKALALYYYNLACNIPLYLHITMAADNDRCLFFWWAASTVRHLGIGGKYGHPTVNPKDLAPFDPETRFAAYRRQMALYRRLKPYFARGTFHGLGEHAHLHTLPGRAGGALLLFNLADDNRAIEAEIPLASLGADAPLPVNGAHAEWNERRLLVRIRLAPMSPAVVRIGDAALDPE